MSTCTGIAAVCVVGLVAMNETWAHKVIGDEFTARYVDSDNDPEFAKTVKKARCWVCHQGRSKANYNPYGAALAERLPAKQDHKDPAAVIAALQAVAKLPSDPTDESSLTFGELIANGELPGGSLEEARKEPGE